MVSGSLKRLFGTKIAAAYPEPTFKTAGLKKGSLKTQYRFSGCLDAQKAEAALLPHPCLHLPVIANAHKYRYIRRANTYAAHRCSKAA